MTGEERKWPLPPMVHRGLEEREGEVRTEPDVLGGAETPLPPPFVAVEFRSSDRTIIEAVPVAVPELDELGPGLDDVVIQGQVEEGEQGRREEPTQASFVTAPDSSFSGTAAELPEIGEGEEVAEGTPPPPPSPQEEVALLLERLAKEVRDRDTIQLEADPGGPPLEGVLRGMLSGYLTHLRKRPG